jgi:hypothetical protein
MRRLVVLGCVALVMGCSKQDAAPAADTMAVAAAPTVNLADVAGTWDMKVMGLTSDSVVASGEIVATATTDGWMMNLPNRPPIPTRVSVSGDSIMIDAGPYESVLRPGTQVSTHTVTRLQGGRLVGTTLATYASGENPVVNLRMEATRKP